jgi:Ca2+-binding RTX toxin-like protein
MSGHVRGGYDFIHGGRGNDGIVGDASDMWGSPQGGDDLLHGGTGDDIIAGDAGGVIHIDASQAGFDRDPAQYACGGDDVLNGGKGNDIIDGDFSSVFGVAICGGNDILNGNENDDLLIGDFGDDHDSVSDATIRGGNDILSGGEGADRLWGDFIGDLDTAVRGADRFVFALGSDHDVISDFEHLKDKIDLSGYRGIGSFAEVRAHAAQSEADTVIDLGAAAGGYAGADVLTLTGIRLASLDAQDFLFA